MYDLGYTLSAGHLTRVCKSMSDVCLFWLSLLGSTNTQTLSYSHSSSWLGLHHVTHFATIVFYLGFCWFRWKSMGELLDYEPSLPQKWIFWEEANGAGHKQYLHNVYTISKRATSIRARNTWATEFLWALRIRAKTWIGLCTCWNT